MNILQDAQCYLELKDLYTPEEAATWMTSPHPQLGGRRPTDCDQNEVLEVIDRLKSGAYT